MAFYSIAAQLNTYYLTFSTAISNVYIPRVNTMVAANCSNWQLTELFTRIGRLQFLVLSLVVALLVVFGEAFITLWAGPDYVNAYQMSLLLIIPVTIPLIQNLGIEIQRAKNMHKFRSWVYMFIAMGNVLITIPLVKMWGGFGAAFGTAIALTIGNVLIMNWYYHYKVGLNIAYFSKQIIKIMPALIIPAVAGFLLMHFVDLVQIRFFVLSALAYIALFFVCLWYLGMNDYEHDLLAKPLMKLKSKFFK